MPRKHPTNAHKKYSKWSPEQMQKAITAVRENGVSISAAAKEHNVPRKTLSDKVNEKHPLKPGRKTALSSEEELALVNYITYMADHAFPLTIPMIKSFASSIAKRSGNNDIFNLETGAGKTWWNEFRKRHSEALAVRKPDKLDRGRARMTNTTVIKRHFETLEKVLNENNIYDKPEKIFNVDESGMNLELRKGKVVINRSSKHAYSQAKGGRDHVTVNCCISAAGQLIPPMIIYERSYPCGNYVAKGPDGALYAKSPNGYMDEELFKAWFSKLFIPHTAHLGKRMLIIDGHGSHLSLEIIDKARAADVILYCLPPHTTHVLQPLDVGLYSPLKSYFSRITDKIQILRLEVTHNVTICKTEFSAVFKLAFEEAFSLSKIKSAFASCGIFPYNMFAINMKRLMPSNQILPLDVATPQSSSAIQTCTTPQSNVCSAINTNSPSDPSTSAIQAIINWQPYLKGQYRKYAVFIGLKCLTPGFVQTGINITSVATIMVCRK